MKTKKKLNKKYKVFINSKFKKGTLDLSHALFTGKSKRNFFSSYLCHPSMANNELSGPTVLTELANSLKIKKTYAFHIDLLFCQRLLVLFVILKNIIAF